MTDHQRRRRPHNELKFAVADYLLSLDSQTASTQEIIQATQSQLNGPPQSSYRSALQDERVFTRVSRGMFTLARRDSTEPQL